MAKNFSAKSQKSNSTATESTIDDMLREAIHSERCFGNSLFKSTLFGDAIRYISPSLRQKYAEKLAEWSKDNGLFIDLLDDNIRGTRPSPELGEQASLTIFQDQIKALQQIAVWFLLPPNDADLLSFPK
jgi:hypothetical protein